MVNGRKENKMVKVSLSSRMETVMMEIGKMVKCMVMVHMKMQVLKFKANGNMEI